MNEQTLFEHAKNSLEQGEYETAIAVLEKCLEINTNEIEYYWYLGLAYLLKDQEEEAQSVWMYVFLQGTPIEIEDWTKQLIQLLEQFLIHFLELQDMEKSIVILDTINSLEENYQNSSLDLQNTQKNWLISNLLKRGITLAQNRQFLEAEKLFAKILKFKTMLNLLDNTDIIWYNLAILYCESGQMESGINAINQAINSNRQNADYFNLLGMLLEQMGKYGEAVIAYQKALELGLQKNEDIFISLGYCYFKMNQSDLAIKQLENALTQYPNDLRLKRLDQSILPIIYKDNNEIQFYRNRFSNLLDELLEFVNSNPLIVKKQGIQSLQITTNLFLGYQGKNDLVLQKKYGELVRKIIQISYPQYSKSSRSSDQSNHKIKIGYISQRLQGMLGLLTAGWVKNHDREKFEVYSYNLAVNQEQTIHYIFEENSYCYREFPLELEKICDQIIKDQLDILVYLDIGMDPIITILAAMKLAPIQCTTWSHPITSGLETIDYFLSSKLMEPENGDEHYTEKLIRLPNLGISFPKPMIPELTINRQSLGLAQDSTIYLSCQSLFKYLPKFDDIYPQIVLEVPNAKFIFIGLNNDPISNQIFEQRLKQAFANYHLDSETFCQIFPRASHGQFLALNQLADIGLDTYSWSGGITTLHAIACNLPVVTCPGDFMRSRHTYGILKMLGVTETIAQDEVDYIQIAVRLGREPEWRQAIRDRIQINQYRMYDDITCIHELETFYKQAVERLML